MKKTIALALSIVLVLASLSCFAQAEEGPKFVTIQEWMDAKGECGDCMLLLKVIQVLNPVVALAADETGTVNLFSGANDPESFVAFFDEEKGMLARMKAPLKWLTGPCCGFSRTWKRNKPHTVIGRSESGNHSR